MNKWVSTRPSASISSASTEEFLLRTVGSLRTQEEVWKRVGHAAKVFFEGFEGEVGVIKVKTAFARKAPEALLIDVIGGVERRQQVCSADADFARLPDLRWRNPLFNDREVSPAVGARSAARPEGQLHPVDIAVAGLHGDLRSDLPPVAATAMARSVGRRGSGRRPLCCSPAGWWTRALDFADDDGTPMGVAAHSRLANFEAMPEDDHRYELIHGTLLVTPAPDTRHQRCVARHVIAQGSAAEPGTEVLPAP